MKQGFTLSQNVKGEVFQLPFTSIQSSKTTPSARSTRTRLLDSPNDISLPQSSKKIHSQSSAQKLRKFIDFTDLKEENIVNFDKGALLVKETDLGSKYFKIQRIENHLKIEKGMLNLYNLKKKLISFQTDNEAIESIKSQILSYSAQGYKIYPELFIFDFDQEDLNLGIKFQESKDSPNSLPNFRPKEWKNEDDPTGWYMCERKCGIRCIWTGTELYSSKGTKYSPPKQFTAGLPKVTLDGILYSQKNSLGSIKNAIKNAESDLSVWADLKFTIYDAPYIEKPFEQRLAILTKKCSQINSSYIDIIDYKKCQNREDFLEKMEACRQAGGEGFYLKKADGLYSENRACFEARVMHQQVGEILDNADVEASGRSLAGYLRIKDKNGEQFSISVNKKRTKGLNKDDFQKGVQVIYEFCGMVTSNKAKKPFFVALAQK